MMGGSQTSAREAAKADAVVDPSRIVRGLVQMGSPGTLNKLGGMVDVLGGTKDKWLMPEGVSRELGDALTGRSTDALQRAFRVEGLTENAKRQMIKALTAATASGGQNTMQNALGAN